MRILGIGLGTVLLGLGGAGWSLDFFSGTNPSHPIAMTIRDAVTATAVFMHSTLGSQLTGQEILDALTGHIPQVGVVPAWVSPAAGFAMLILALLSGRRRFEQPAPVPGLVQERSQAKEPALPNALSRQVKKLVKQGRGVEAGEILAAQGFKSHAARTFRDAEQFDRAAALYVQEACPEEAAECFEKGQNWENAGKIYAEQGDYQRAAKCYAQVGKSTVAAEMFEKAGCHRQAAEAYFEAEYFRYAANAFVQCKDWRRAGASLERVLGEEGAGTSSADPERRKAYRKLVLQAGKLYEQAGDLTKASQILEKGNCYGAAGEIELARGDFERAGELFLRARDSQRAAEAFRYGGQEKRAAQLLGEYHRERGELAQAAALFEEAENFFDAADLYRTVEDFDRAGICYERDGNAGQAAAMFVLGGDRRRAAQNYEFAGQFLDAAACYAEVGETQKELALLEQAGAYFRVGQACHKNGDTEGAISILQKVEAGSPDFRAASHLLGELFYSKGMMPLSIKKLRQSVGEEELKRENIESYYLLACAYEANEQTQEAVGLFERILALDYKYQDVEVRLEACREQLRNVLAAGGVASATKGREQTLGTEVRYKIVGQLGRGGMGIVYKATDSLLDRVVAYKVLPNELRESPKALKNFLREAKSAAQLNHPNIVTVYDAGEQDGRFYIAMEYVEGTTLKEILRTRNKIPVVWVLHVLVQVCEALAYAHDKKIVHRDVKPANMMWTREKQAKIMDFGLAKVIEEVRNHTTVVAGTPYYMSPEQTLGRNVDHRTDIYSLGVTLFELVTGRLPFRDGNVPYHHVHTPAPDPRGINPDLPAPLAKIIVKCLEKDPDARFGSAREVISAVKTAMTRGKTTQDTGRPAPSKS